MPEFSIAKVNGVKIGGLAACIPATEIDNAVAMKELYGEETENVIRTTGVAKRRICSGNVTSLDLCIKAAEYLKDESDYDVEQIGAVVFVTASPDYLIPNNSTYVQHKLGLSNSVAVYDINHACPGFIYGLWNASMVATSMQKPVLLLDGETHSHFASPKDRATAALFGDAGAALIIEPCKEAKEWTFSFYTDGSQHDALVIPEGGYRNRIDSTSADYKQYADGGYRRGIDVTMDGMGVFNFVVRSVPKNINYLMEQTGTTPEDYDILALHQANLFMVKQVAKKLKFPAEKVPTTIQKFGNSSSATIPVTLASECQEELRNKNCKLLASGFGAGLALASVSCEIGPCVCPGVIEYDE